MSEFVRIGAVDDFEPGQLYERRVNGKYVAIVRSGERFYAMENACTHAGYSLYPGNIQDGTVPCPVHGAVFRLEDGEPIAGPASDPLDLYDVRIEGSDVLVAPR